MIGCPGTTPQHGQIVASNGMFLCHLLNILGRMRLIMAISLMIKALEDAFNHAQSADMIITTGGALLDARGVPYGHR